MNHETVEQRQVIDRYLMNRLSAREAAEFEEHYLDCAQCLEQLELSEAFQSGLRNTASEDAADAAIQTGLLAALARAARSPRAGLLAAAVLVLVLLPLGYLARRVERTAQVNSELVDELARALAPQANTPVLPLSPERSGDEPSSALVRLPEPPAWIVFSLELDRAVADGFEVTLQGPGRETLWRGTGLVPNHQDSLVLSLHSTLLFSGEHTFLVEAITGAGEPVAVGRFSFRALESSDPT